MIFSKCRDYTVQFAKGVFFTVYFRYCYTEIRKGKKFIMPTIIKIMLISLSFITLPAYADIQIFKPAFPKYDAKEQLNRKHKEISIGMATINHQFKIPIYGVEVPNPLEDGMYGAYQSCQKPKVCNFDIAHFDATQSNDFKIVIFPGLRTTLVPKSWQVVDAAYGVNGTASAKIMSPNHDEAITLYNSSICVGCGLPNATLFFPELLKESLENEFGGYKDSHKYLTIVRPNKNTAYYSFQIPNYPNKTHGIATYDNEDTFNYQEIEVSLLPSHKAQARYILNMFQSSTTQF